MTEATDISLNDIPIPVDQEFTPLDKNDPLYSIIHPFIIDPLSTHSYEFLYSYSKDYLSIYAKSKSKKSGFERTTFAKYIPLLLEKEILVKNSDGPRTKSSYSLSLPAMRYYCLQYIMKFVNPEYRHWLGRIHELTDGKDELFFHDVAIFSDKELINNDKISIIQEILVNELGWTWDRTGKFGDRSGRNKTCWKEFIELQGTPVNGKLRLEFSNTGTFSILISEYEIEIDYLGAKLFDKTKIPNAYEVDTYYVWSRDYINKILDQIGIQFIDFNYYCKKIAPTIFLDDMKIDDIPESLREKLGDSPEIARKKFDGPVDTLHRVGMTRQDIKNLSNYYRISHVRGVFFGKYRVVRNKKKMVQCECHIRHRNEVSDHIFNELIHNKKDFSSSSNPERIDKYHKNKGRQSSVDEFRKLNIEEYLLVKTDQIDKKTTANQRGLFDVDRKIDKKTGDINQNRQEILHTRNDLNHQYDRINSLAQINSDTMNNVTLGFTAVQETIFDINEHYNQNLKSTRDDFEEQMFIVNEKLRVIQKGSELEEEKRKTLEQEISTSKELHQDRLIEISERSLANEKDHDETKTLIKELIKLSTNTLTRTEQNRKVLEEQSQNIQINNNSISDLKDIFIANAAISKNEKEKAEIEAKKELALAKIQADKEIALAKIQAENTPKWKKLFKK